jgi:hypothetical protein
MRQMTKAGRGLLRGLFTAAGLVLVTSAAQAISPEPNEKELLKACEEKLCTAFNKPADASGQLACKISKTWQKSTIEDGIRQKNISWSFGDARCDLNVDLSNDEIKAAMSNPTHTIKIKPHTITCKIERESEITDVSLSVAPSLDFKDGKVTKVLLNVDKIQAPTLIKGAIWTVSQLEDNIGLFHGDMVREINKFIGEKCPKRYPSK